MRKFLGIVRNNEGATAIEYGLIAALIAVAALSALQGLGSELSSTFSQASTSMKEANSAN